MSKKILICTALTALIHDSVRYPVGATIELEEQEAQAIIPYIKIEGAKEAVSDNQNTELKDGEQNTEAEKTATAQGAADGGTGGESADDTGADSGADSGGLTAADVVAEAGAPVVQPDAPSGEVVPKDQVSESAEEPKAAAPKKAAAKKAAPAKKTAEE